MTDKLTEKVNEMYGEIVQLKEQLRSRDLDFGHLVQDIKRKISDLDDEYSSLLKAGDMTNTKQTKYREWKNALNWVLEQIK